jgi:RHS repeat-associated protein
VSQRLAYAAFGAIGSIKDGQGNDVTTGPISRFAYTGREFDPETGDYYYRARYFDPQTGRFLSQDPIGFAAGDMNLYRYVSNSTPNFTDPTGLAASGYVNNVPTNPGPRPPVSSTMGTGPQGSISGYTPSNPFGYGNAPTMTTEGFGDPLPGSDPPINIPEPNPIGIVTPIDWDPTRPSTPYPEPIHPSRPGDIPGRSQPGDVQIPGPNTILEGGIVFFLLTGNKAFGFCRQAAEPRPFRDRLADVQANPDKWVVIRREVVDATGRHNKGGTSVQELLRNCKTGETIVRHTLFRPDGKFFEKPHYRDQWK